MAQNDNFDSIVGIDQLNMGIRKEAISHIVQALSVALANTYTLYLKTQGCHWNVVGPHFYALHKLFEEQYEELGIANDDLAERIRTLGYPVPANFADFSKLSRISEADYRNSVRGLLHELVNDHQTIAIDLRELVEIAESAHDQATVDLASERIATHEKAAWMLRSTLA